MALQEMYGKGTSSNPENTTYNYSETSPPFEAIYDTGGLDTLDLSSLSGGSDLDLSGNKLSTIGNNFLKPWKNETSGTSFGTAQGSKLAIIDGTQIEKILLPSDTSTLKTGSYSTYIVGSV